MDCLFFTLNGEYRYQEPVEQLIIIGSTEGTIYVVVKVKNKLYLPFHHALCLQSSLGEGSPESHKVLSVWNFLWYII